MFHHTCDQSKVTHDRIRIIFSRRNPGEPVGPDELLVAMYAWDGNSFPGNEFWDGHLDNSGDPAAACCSAIAVLQNPDVNPRLRDAAGVLPREPPPPLVSIVQQGLIVQEPTAYTDPTAEEPTAYTNPTAEEPTAEEPTAEEPTAEEPTA